ncbi:MAG: hypothetical protein MHM6MM_002673 [Cercozoa sp. M6MM]
MGRKHRHKKRARAGGAVAPIRKKFQTKAPPSGADAGDKKRRQGQKILTQLSQDVTSAAPVGALAHSFFQWLIAPVSTDAFFSETFEKKPMYVQRSDKDSAYFNSIWSKSHVDSILRQHDCEYDVDVTVSVVDEKTGQRVNLAPPEGGKAEADDVWKLSSEKGASVRVLRPQQHDKQVWHMLHLLDRYFGMQCGANSYLTPINTRGFAAHYDDVDVFLLQVEGFKKWQLFRPTNVVEQGEVVEDQFLATHYSRDYADQELEGMTKLMEVTLGPGDLLYMPRGTVHRGEAVADPSGKDTCEYSHHLTVSTAQQSSWMHFLALSLPAALQEAAKLDIDFRRTLPRHVFDFMGSVHEQRIDGRRELFHEQLSERLTSLANHFPADAAVDQHRMLEQQERGETVEDLPSKELKLSDRIRVLHKDVARIAIETPADADEPQCVVYHCVGNSRVFNDDSENELRFTLEFAPTLRALLVDTGDHADEDALATMARTNSGEESVEDGWHLVKELPGEDLDEEDRLILAQALYDAGLVYLRH